MRKYFVEEKTEMKKTNVENVKEVTHEIEFRFSFANNNYMWPYKKIVAVFSNFWVLVKIV